MKGAVGGNKLKVMYENITFNSRKLITGYVEEFEKVNLQKQKSIARQTEIE